MIIKLAVNAGGTFDQMISNGILPASYARLTKDKKQDMHHGKAIGIGAGIGAGLAGSAGLLTNKLVNKVKIKPWYSRYHKTDRDLFKAVKKFKAIPRGKKLAALGLLTAIGALAGGSAGLSANAQVRTLRAAQRGQRS